MNKAKLLELLLKKKSGNITMSEQLELTRFLSEQESIEIISEINIILNIPLNFDESVKTEDIDSSIERVLKKIDHPGIRNINRPAKVGRIRRTISIAAAAIVLIVAGYYLWNNGNEPSSKGIASVKSTKKGTKSTLTLPDGTKVWINSDSKIIYDELFDQSTRVVELSGEAFFDVAHDKKRPFIVRTKNIDVKVLGTVFNVRAYPAERNTQATLLSGSIEMHLKTQKDRVILLKPNEKIVVKNFNTVQKKVGDINLEEPEIILTKVIQNPTDSSTVETRWVKNTIVFSNDELKNIAHTLEQWYGYKINITDKKLKEKRLSGVFENKSISEVLEALKLVAEFDYRMVGDTITIIK